MHPCIGIDTCTCDYIEQQYLIFEVSVKSGISAALKISIIGSSFHEFSPFLIIFGGLHRVLKVMQHFLWKSENQFYSVNEWDGDPKSLFPKCVHPTFPPKEQHSKKG